MATTTTQSTHVNAMPPFAEHDKLGPLGGKPQVMNNDSELRRALVAEFANAAEAAREASASVERGPADAVHSYRKALRRARAVLALVSRALPKSERRAVRRALREARRALGAARDHAVAPETLAGLPLDPIVRETAGAIVRTATDAMAPAAEIKQLLAEGAARTAAQVEALEAALPAGVPWSVVAKGVRSTYDDARRARRAAKRSKRSFHTWRRRSKELGYQLELLANLAGPHVNELHREIEGATDPQGPAVDLIMLRDFVDTYSQGVSPDSLDPLVDAIDAQLDELASAARKAGKTAFAKKPRRFARRLTKAMRRDFAPPTPADDNVA
ncbi:MAG TPA: CHAD domain-containing protein [Kofleriaceae bacterium]|nr:CHAD domain-containing protein [Kofleriaceae bacterium]